MLTDQLLGQLGRCKRLAEDMWFDSIRQHQLMDVGRPALGNRLLTCINLVRFQGVQPNNEGSAGTALLT